MQITETVARRIAKELNTEAGDGNSGQRARFDLETGRLIDYIRSDLTGVGPRHPDDPTIATLAIPWANGRRWSAQSVLDALESDDEWS